MLHFLFFNSTDIPHDTHISYIITITSIFRYITFTTEAFFEFAQDEWRYACTLLAAAGQIGGVCLASWTDFLLEYGEVWRSFANSHQ